MGLREDTRNIITAQAEAAHTIINRLSSMDMSDSVLINLAAGNLLTGIMALLMDVADDLGVIREILEKGETDAGSRGGSD